MTVGKTKKHLVSYKILTFAVSFLVVSFVVLAIVFTFLPKRDDTAKEVEQNSILAVVSQDTPQTNQSSSILLTSTQLDQTMQNISLPQSAFFDFSNFGRVAFVNVQIDNIASSFCIELSPKNFGSQANIYFYVGKNFASSAECREYLLSLTDEELKTNLIFSKDQRFELQVEKNDSWKGAIIIATDATNFDFDLNAQIRQEATEPQYLEFDFKYVLPYSANLNIESKNISMTFDKELVLPTNGKITQNSNWCISNHQKIDVDVQSDVVELLRFSPGQIEFLTDEGIARQKIEDGYKYIFALCDYNPLVFLQAKQYFQNNMQEVKNSVQTDTNLILRVHKFSLAYSIIAKSLGSEFFESLANGTEQTNFALETKIWYDLCKDIVASKIETAVKNGALDESSVSEICPVLHQDLVLCQYGAKAQNLFDVFEKIDLADFDVRYSFLKDGENTISFSTKTFESDYVFDNITIDEQLDIENLDLSKAKCKAYVLPSTDQYVFDDGAIFSADKTRILLFAPYADATEFLMPQSVETILLNAFSNAQFLKKLSIYQAQLTEQNANAILNGHFETVQVVDASSDILQNEFAKKLFENGILVLSMA